MFTLQITTTLTPSLRRLCQHFQVPFTKGLAIFLICKNVIFAINLSKSLIANKKQENMYFYWLYTESLELDMTGHQEAAQQLNW